MVGRKKKTKICDKGSQEDWISKLPDHLMSEILVHLPTKDVVKTSLLSTKWRSLWQLVPGLDLDLDAFLNIDAFVSFADKFIDSHRHRDSWIQKLRLRINRSSDRESVLTPWIDAVTRRKIQHLDLIDPSDRPYKYAIPLSIYTCKTLVHLGLYSTVLANAEFVSLPCLKIMHLHHTKNLREATLKKLISGSPVLEDLAITGFNDSREDEKISIQVRSHTLKRIHINNRIQVVIDAPLLQLLTADVFAIKNFQIINLGFSTKLDLDISFSEATDSKCLIHGILDDISKVRDLVIRKITWQCVFRHSEMGRLSRGFRSLTRLNAKFLKSDLEKLPIILESCQKLESLILELDADSYMRKKNREPKLIMFPTVPECMVSSLKFVELKRSVSRYDGEMELLRYFLKNSTFLEKLRLDLYHTKKDKCDFLKELVAMPRCSRSCEVLVL